MRLPIPIESPHSGSGPSYGRGGDFKRREKETGLFWWTIAITFLIVLTAGTWIFCLFLFAFPEKEMNYRLLAKLGKLDSLKNFDVSSVPTGKFFVARDLYKRFYHFGSEQLVGTNAKLKRNYLRNYDGEDPIFVKGLFRIEQVRALSESDYFRSGMVVQALSVEEIEHGVSKAPTKRVFPNAVFEFVFPAEDVPESRFNVGDELSIDTLKDFASVMHIERVGTDHLCFSAVPILYGSYQLSESDTIALGPPQSVNVEGSWPIFEKEVQVSSSSTASVSSAVLPVEN